MAVGRPRMSRAAGVGAAVLGLAAVAGTGFADAGQRPQQQPTISALQTRLAKLVAHRDAAPAGSVRAFGEVPLSAPGLHLTALNLNSTASAGDWEVLSPNGRTLYVSQTSIFGGTGSSGNVEVINLSDPSAAPKLIKVPGGADVTSASALAVSPNGKTLYIGEAPASGTAGTTIVLAANVGGGASNDTVVGAITGSGGLAEVTGLAVAPDAKTLYITGLSSTSGSVVTSGLTAVKLKTATSGVIGKAKVLPKLGAAFSMTLNRAGTILYTSNPLGAAAATSVSGTKLGSPRLLPEVYGSDWLAISPDGGTLYSNSIGLFAGESGAGVSSEPINTYGLVDGGFSADLAHSTLVSGYTPTAIALNTAGSEGYVPTEAEKATSSGGTTTTTMVYGLRRFMIAPALTRVRIVGSAKVGASVDAKVTGVRGATTSYHWYADGRGIRGADGARLKLGKGLAGKKLAVKVRSTAVGYRMSSAEASVSVR